MKPARFAYAAPASVAEAVGILHETGSDAVVLAGGQSLLPALNFRLGAPELVLDVNGIAELQGIHMQEGTLSIGALTRHTELLHSSLVRECLAALPKAARHIGHAPIRNRGTTGGSFAHADPAAELPAVAAAVDGEIELTSYAGTRTIPFAEFALGPFLTAKRADELITGVRLPIDASFAWGCAEVTRRSGDFALAGAVVGIAVREGAAAGLRIALFGVEPVPRRLHELEQALTEAPVSGLGHLVAESEIELDIVADDEVAAGYRRHLARAAIASALDEACRQGGGPK